MKRLIASGCISALLGYGGALAWNFERYSHDDSYRDARILYNHTAVPVLFFGDSVLTTVGRCDKDKRSIDQMLGDTLEIPVARIQHGAYSPAIYRHYVSLFQNTKYQPGFVVLPINLRAWSPEWADRPLYRFSLRGAWIQIKNGDGVDAVALFDNLALSKDKNDAKAWSARRVYSYDGQYLGTNGELARLRAHADLDCGVEEPSAEDKAILARRFLWHYASPAQEEAAMDKALVETISALRSRGIGVLSYFTPLNFVDGENVAGSGMRFAAELRIERIRRLLEKSGVQVLDLHDLVPSDHFIDKVLSCEHLDDQGRLAVAHRLVGAVKLMMREGDVGNVDLRTSPSQ